MIAQRRRGKGRGDAYMDRILPQELLRSIGQGHCDVLDQTTILAGKYQNSVVMRHHGEPGCALGKGLRPCPIGQYDLIGQSHLCRA